MNNIEKLARTLQEMFDLRFNRQWKYLPEDVQEEWIENARELVKRMKEND